MCTRTCSTQPGTATAKSQDYVSQVSANIPAAPDKPAVLVNGQMISMADVKTLLEARPYPNVLKQTNYLAEAAYYNHGGRFSIFGKYEMRKISDEYSGALQAGQNQYWAAGGIKYYLAPFNLYNFALQYERNQFTDTDKITTPGRLRSCATAPPGETRQDSPRSGARLRRCARRGENAVRSSRDRERAAGAG